MGVYIKGIDMPGSCLRCPLFAGNGCKATNRIFPDWLNVAMRPDACPLVEIKAPHGRLGDLDALRAKMYHEAFETDSDMQRWESGCWIRYKLFERTEEAAPTVLEAEGKDDV